MPKHGGTSGTAPGVNSPPPHPDSNPPSNPPSGDPSSSQSSSSSSSSSSNSNSKPNDPTYNFSEVEQRARKLLHKVLDDIDSSDLHKTQSDLATTFAVYSFFPLVVVLYHVWKRAKLWAEQELATSVQLHHAQVAEENKRAALRRVAKVLPKLFLLTQILCIVFYVTEAIAARGGIITTFEQYRFTLAQRYLSVSLADLSLLAMLLYLVNFRLTRLEKILLALCTLVVITVYGLMNAVSPPPSFDSFSDSTSSEDTIANAAMILRHIETGFYVILAYIVCGTIKRLKISLASENKNLKRGYTCILYLLALKILEYLIYYIFYYAVEDSDDIFYIVNFVVCAVCDFLIMHCIMAVLPVEPKSKSGDSSPPGEG